MISSMQHPAWCVDVGFLPYLPPTYEGGEVDAMWVEAMELIDGDLHWLLQLPHQAFWSQVRDCAYQTSH